MALSRIFQKIFGKNATLTDLGVVGSKNENNPQYSKNIADLQSLANWETGMRAIVTSSNAPYLQDHNSLFYVITTQLAYLFQAGIAEWEVSTEYFSGRSVVLRNGKIYIAKADSTGVEPEVTSGWETSWVSIFDLMLQGISYSSLPTGVFGNYKKGDNLTHKDEFGNPITITALKNNPSEPSNDNIYYVKSKIKITEVVNSFPTPTLSIVGNVYFNSTTNEMKKVIEVNSIPLFKDLPIDKFNTLVDDNDVYYDFNGASLIDVSLNYDWIVKDIYIKQQKNVENGWWYIIWSSGVVEQGLRYYGNLPLTPVAQKIPIYLYAETSNFYVGILKIKASCDYFKNGVGIDGLTMDTKIVDGIEHKYIMQVIVSGGQLVAHAGDEDWIDLYIKGHISPIQNA